jgi:hypothetical protein
MSFTGRDEVFLSKTLPNNDFMPDIKLGDFQEQYRIATVYSQAMVETALILAMLEINNRLRAKQAEWQAAGASEIYDVPNQPLEEGYAYLYIAAVSHWAKAELMRDMPTVTDRKTSDITGTNAESTESWNRKRADQYVRQILGKTGITCELL